MSAILSVYGFGDLLAFNVNRKRARAPAEWMVLGILTIAIDTLFRALFIAYCFAIFKWGALFLIPSYFGLMVIGICLKKKKCKIDPYDMFGTFMSFGCSGGETFSVNYNFR